MARRRKERRSKSAGPERGRRAGGGLRWLAVIALAMVVGIVGTLWLVGKGADSPRGGAKSAAPVEGGRPPGDVRRRAGLDLLLITIDTLRADALGCYGRAGAHTPWMDRLATEGVRFDNAHAHNVLTLPSHANILSGLYPQEHGVRDNSGFRFPANVPTLAETLRAQGYRTGAFVSAFPLDSRFGLDRGFEIYEDSFVDAASRPAFLELERSGADTVALAREWLFAADPRPAFAWVHLYEPHFPYDPPEPWASRFAGNAYQGDVAAADAALEPLLRPILDAAKAAPGAGRPTLVVLTSDHGESLGEHGEATHGIFAYEGVLRAPLILYQPELLEPRVVDASARHVDLMPTILDALEAPMPAGLRGRSLLPVAVGQLEAEPPGVYFEALSGQLNRGWAPLYGVIDRGWKYVDLPIPELYDLASDPQETTNLAARSPERLAEARAALAPLRRLDPGRSPSPEIAEVREALAALGYLGASQGGPERRVYGEADDPKNLIELDADLRAVASLYQSGDRAGALRVSRELVRRRPGMRVALLSLAQLERESGNLDSAVRALQAALALQPEDAATLAVFASTLTQAGKAGEAVEVTEPHARLAQPDVEVLLTRALALARVGRPDDALAALRKAQTLDPRNAKVAVYLGTFYLMGGRRDAARLAYEHALELNPRTASASSSLAIMAVEEGRLDASLEHWRRALAADPSEHAKLLAVADGLWQAGRRREARALFELFASSAPPALYTREIEHVRGLLAGSG